MQIKMINMPQYTSLVKRKLVYDIFKATLIIFIVILKNDKSGNFPRGDKFER